MIANDNPVCAFCHIEMTQLIMRSGHVYASCKRCTALLVSEYSSKGADDAEFQRLLKRQEIEVSSDCYRYT